MRRILISTSNRSKDHFPNTVTSATKARMSSSSAKTEVTREDVVQEAAKLTRSLYR